MFLPGCGTSHCGVVWALEKFLDFEAFEFQIGVTDAQHMYVHTHIYAPCIHHLIYI